MPKTICIGVPQFLGEPAPNRIEIQQIQEAGFIQSINAEYVEIEPHYDAFEHPVNAVNAALAQTIADHSDYFPVVLASDCVSSLGMVKGLAQRHANVGLVWFDAHGDFNTPETSPSGFLGGMPLAALVGRGNQHLMTGINLNPIPENHVRFTDGRDLDPEEGKNLRASDITLYENVSDLLDASLPAHPVYVHLDVDIVDPQYMPALGYPAAGGPSPETVSIVLERLAAEASVVGLLVSLWNADKGDSDTCRDSTLQMMNALLRAL